MDSFDPSTAALSLPAGAILSFEYPVRSARAFVQSLRDFDSDESEYYIPYESRVAQLERTRMTASGNVVMLCQQTDGSYRCFAPELIRNLSVLG